MSIEAINQLYIDNYGRPASQGELDYHANRFGSELDAQEAAALTNEMVSVPGYTAPAAPVAAPVESSAPATTPVESSAPANTYTTEEKSVGMGITETVYRDANTGNVISEDQAMSGTRVSDGSTPDAFDFGSNLTEIYQNVLGRDATADDIAYYKAEFGDSIDANERQQLFTSMMQDSDAAQSGAFQAYQDVFGAAPTEYGDFMKARKAVGATLDEGEAQKYFESVIPELGSDNTVKQFQNVLGRDPSLDAYKYYRDVDPDAIQDATTFRQTAITGGEFGNRAAEMFEQEMGYAPSEAELNNILNSNINLNQDSFTTGLAGINIANRPATSTIQPLSGFTPQPSLAPQPRMQPTGMPLNDPLAATINLAPTRVIAGQQFYQTPTSLAPAPIQSTFNNTPSTASAPSSVASMASSFAMGGQVQPMDGQPSSSFSPPPPPPSPIQSRSPMFEGNSGNQGGFNIKGINNGVRGLLENIQQEMRPVFGLKNSLHGYLQDTRGMQGGMGNTSPYDSRQMQAMDMGGGLGLSNLLRGRRNRIR